MINSDGLHTAAVLYKPKPVLCNVPREGVRCFKEERRHDLCKSTTQKSITKLCFVTFWSFFKKKNVVRYKHKCIHSAMFKYTVVLGILTALCHRHFCVQSFLIIPTRPCTQKTVTPQPSLSPALGNHKQKDIMTHKSIDCRHQMLTRPGKGTLDVS